MDNPAFLSVRAPLMSKTPTIDGVINEDEWSDAFRCEGLVDGTNHLISRRATCWLGTDGKKVYAAMRTEIPPKGELFANIPADQRNSPKLIFDDVFEVWLAAEYSPDKRNPYYQFMANTVGSMFLSKFLPSGPCPPVSGTWEYKCGIRNGMWEAEVAVPVEKILPEDMKKLKSFLFRLVRDWKEPWEFSSSEGWGSAEFRDLHTMSRFEIDPTAPRVQMTSMGNWMDQDLDVGVVLCNPGSTAMKVKVKVYIASTTSMPPFSKEESFTLEPNKPQTYQFKQELFKGVDCNAVLTVSDPAGTTVWVTRKWSLRVTRPEVIWTSVARVKKPVVLRFAYSPYKNKARARMDFSGLKNPAGITKASLVIAAKGGKKALVKIEIKKFKNSIGEIDFNMPELKDGTYECRCSLEGAGAPKKPVVQPFKREHFEWEHNKLGISNKVIEPFTPLKVAGNKVSSIFRDHEMNGFGLWSQVVSEGKPLLTGPMELRAKVGGKAVTLKTGKIEFKESKPHRIVAQAKWEGGGIKGETRSQFDYDGLMGVELKIAGGAKTRVDSLELHVPVKTSECQFMHEVGVGIRGNYAGRIPSGEGEIWSNIRATTYGAANEFVPYIWIGGIRRGICWYADTDKDWVVADDHREVSMVRNGETTSLVFHLIGKPVDLARARTMKFHFQATPVKPRPANWRSLSFLQKMPNATRIDIFGSGGYWGAVSSFGDVYPRGRDFRFLERLVEVKKRGRVNDDDQVFIKKWLAGPYQKEHMDHYIYHVNSGFKFAARSDLIIPYTNSHGVRHTLPEFLIFQDEWRMEPYSERDWGNNDMSETGIDPVESYRDYAVWYAKKMMDCGFANGINWDNIFPQSNINPLSNSDMYIDEQGKPHPGVGMSGMRELVKRTTVMFRESGNVPYHIPHMTNAAMIPILAFSPMQGDWEMNLGSDDFQDRFSEDFIFACSLGEQAGTIPVVLTLIVAPKDAPPERSSNWLTRTLLGVLWTYEIRGYYGRDVDWDLIKVIDCAIFDFGYGLPDCKVYRYWDENTPFKSSRPDVRCLLVRRPGKLMLVATDFGNGGPVSIALDLKALGIKGSPSGVNVETKQMVRMEQGTLKLDLKKHDFNLLLIQE
jgi:hypothetical protein